MDERERELWRRYAQDDDVEARDYLFLKYAGWVRAVVAATMRRLPRLGLEWDDHLQNAYVGLLEAMERFDVERGIDFMAYSKPRVRGAVFNGLRVVKTFDSLDQQERWSERVESLGGDGETDALQAFVDLVVGTSLAHLLSSTGQDIGAEDARLSRHILEDALMDLPARSREILVAHYYRGIPFQEIAAQMQLTKGRISQLHRAGLMQLREHLRQRRYERDSFF